MKKLLMMLSALLFSANIYSQIGLNTESPKATLHVEAKTIDGSLPEGFIAPRLTGDALFTAGSGTTPQYGTDQDGAIVYVTAAVSPGNDVGQTINVNAPGYYYFDGIADQWKKVGDGSNIYNTDGTLASSRIMNLDSHTMGFMNGRVGVGINPTHPSALLHLESTTRGFLPPRMTKVQMDAITNPTLGLVIYCTDCFAGNTGCLMVNDSAIETVPNWGSLCSSNATSPDVLTLECASAVTTGMLYQGVPASGVSTSVPYTGGNGGIYTASNFGSTGVTGLTASLPGGVLNTGNGNLVFMITGTPASTGTASFAITVAGKSCTFTIQVTTQTATVGSLNCGSATFAPAALTQGTAYSGTLTVPYTGGNGGSYSQVSFAVNGLNFTLPAGTLVTGNGSLVYNITGTPTAGGAMSVPVTFGGQSCNVTTTVATGNTVVLPGNPNAWMKHNLGADTSLDPDVPVQAIHGNYYQWGRPDVVANASTPADPISGWNMTEAPNNSWQDPVKTTNDPCPAGFRVPTSAQFSNLINNNTDSNVGTFTDSATNFGSAKVFSGGGNKLTFPIAGGRNGANGALNNRGLGGAYWSTTQVTPAYAYMMSLTSSIESISYSGRSIGTSIRCISE